MRLVGGKNVVDLTVNRLDKTQEDWGKKLLLTWTVNGLDKTQEDMKVGKKLLQLQLFTLLQLEDGNEDYSTAYLSNKIAKNVLQVWLVEWKKVFQRIIKFCSCKGNWKKVIEKKISRPCDYLGIGLCTKRSLQCSTLNTVTGTFKLLICTCLRIYYMFTSHQEYLCLMVFVHVVRECNWFENKVYFNVCF